MAKNPVSKVATKKHLARLEREQLQTRYIMIGSAIVLALVVLLIGYGILDQYVLQPAKPVAKVNGDAVSVSEFQANVRYQRYSVISYYNQIFQYFGQNDQYVQQEQYQLTKEVIGQQTLDQLVEDRIIRQEAKRRGITVSKEEVDQAFQKDFGYFPNGTPVPTSTLSPIATSTFSVLQETLMAPTATSTPTMTVAAPTVTPTLVPTIAPTGVLTPTATATPYTQDAYQQNYTKFIKDFKDNLKLSESDMRKIYESRLYREKVKAAILEEQPVSRDEEEIWARHILVSGEVTATQVLDQLKNGADFAQLAAEYSTDTSNKNSGGDLGWFGKGKMDAEFEQAAWSLQVGEVVSAPVKTQFGYHIIQALGHEMRPLQDYAYSQAQETKFTDWLTQQRQELEAQNKLTISSDWSQITPEDPAIPDSTSTTQ
jgi:peptidyl-prolyl cis-trans isomerase D